MEASTISKEIYAASKGERKIFDGQTITHMLLEHETQFLELDETWVDELLS